MASAATRPDHERMRQVKVLLVDDGAEFLASASNFLSRDPRVEWWARRGTAGRAGAWLSCSPQTSCSWTCSCP